MKLLGGLVHTGICISGGVFLGYIITSERRNDIPYTNSVDEGYIVPSKLEIKVTDTNLNGKNEVLMVYNGTRYLLTVDENGKPQVEDYLENLDKRLGIE